MPRSGAKSAPPGALSLQSQFQKEVWEQHVRKELYQRLRPVRYFFRRPNVSWGGTAHAPTGAGFSHNARGFSRAHTVQGGRGHPGAGRRDSRLFTPCYSAGGQLRPRAKTTARLLRTTSSTDVPGARRRAAGTVKQARVAKRGCRASGWAATALPRQV